MACIVFVVDTSPGMLAATACGGAGNPEERTKLQVALEVVREVSLFLTYHAEWESVSLYFVGESYRQVIPLRCARAFQQQLNADIIGDWQKENVPYATNPTAYLSMLAGIHAGVVEAGRHSCVVVLSDGSPRSTGLETAELYPPRYIGKLLPLPFGSFVFYVDLLSSQTPDFSVLPAMLRVTGDRTETFSFDVTRECYDASNLSSLLCQKLFEPWMGQLVFNGINEETCCFFPNPWGFRGRFRGDEAPSKLEVDIIVYHHETAADSGVSRILPLGIAPKLWRTANEFDRLGHISHPEPWMPNAYYGESSSDFLGKLLDSKDFREKRAVLSVNGPKGFSGVLRVGVEDPGKRAHSSDVVVSVHRKYSILLEYTSEQEKAPPVKENVVVQKAERPTSAEEGEIRSENQDSVTIKIDPDGYLEVGQKLKRSLIKKRRTHSPVWPESMDKKYRKDKKRSRRSSSPTDRRAKDAGRRLSTRSAHTSFVRLKARPDVTHSFQDFFVGGLPKGTGPGEVKQQLEARGIEEIRKVYVRPMKKYNSARVSIASTEVDRFLSAGFFEPPVFIDAWISQRHRATHRAKYGTSARVPHSHKLQKTSTLTS